MAEYPIFETLKISTYHGVYCKTLLKLFLILVSLPAGDAVSAGGHTGGAVAGRDIAVAQRPGPEMRRGQSAGDSLRRDSVRFVGDIGEISIRGSRPAAVHTPVLGSIDVGLESIRKLPGLLGSADPMRTLQLMPGVQTTGEISSGLYIRGSNNAHNLVELNGAPIYNAMHMLGIFSVFNNDNLGSFMLRKSHIPARYGGRIGSVVSAGTKTGIPGRFGGAGEIGLIASNLTLAIPTGAGSGLYLSGRISYIGPILRALESPRNGMRLGYNMYDMNAAWILEPSAKDRITVNAYRGRDRLLVDGLYQSEGSVDWGNTVGSLVWNHRFSASRTLSQTFFVSHYDNSIDIRHSSVSLSTPSNITDAGYKALFGHRGGRVYWEYGLSYTFHRVGLQYPIFENYFFTNDPPAPVRTHEGGAFAEASFDISRRVKAAAGLRASVLMHAENGGIAQAYWVPEPRLNVTVRSGELSSISASAAVQQQYMNQVTASNTGFPTDFWVPASAHVPPQRAYSFALGYSRETADRRYEFSGELYCRLLTDQIESLGGMVGNFNSKYDIYRELVYGKGQNFGLEILLNRKYGRLTGWISYTLGWARRSFAGIEDGRWFPASHERRHDISLTAIYRIGEKWTVSSNFVYATGNAYTPTLAIYMIGGVAVNEYGAHNSARLPAYHRMDLSASYEVRSKALPGTLNISVYNVYARKNPIGFYTYMTSTEDGEGLKLKRRHSALYSIIPSVSYSFRF